MPEAGGRLGRGGHVGAAQRLSGQRYPPRRRAARAGPACRPAGRESGAGGARCPRGRRVRAVPVELAWSHRWASGSSGAVRPQKGCVRLSPPVCRPTSVPELYVFSNKLSALLLPPPPGLLLCGCWRLHVVTGECVYVLGPGGSVCISLRGATGSHGTRGRGCAAGLCLLRLEGRINGAACAECFLFLLATSPSSPAGSFRSVRCRKGA